jgi:4'-phosphopantetheinyl transferase
MTVTPPRPASAEVCAWYADIAIFRDQALLDSALCWLDAEERARYERFAHDDDRRMFLLGRVMARRLVGDALGVGPTDWPWRNGPHGRPEIAIADVRVRFNLAHSAGVVVCVVGIDRDIGVDVEHTKRPPVDFAVVRRYCSAAEIADIESQGPSWHDRFLIYWTLKEAYLKARGLGIAVPLAEISFSVQNAHARVAFTGTLARTDDRWRFHLVRPIGDHLIAIAAATADGVQPEFALRVFDAHTIQRGSGGR